MSSPRSSNKTDLSTTSSPLPGLPAKVIKTDLCPRWILKEGGLFARASHKTEADTAFLRLLPGAVDAEPESYKISTENDPSKLAAIAILQRHPELLFRKGVVKDHFNRTIEGSPYQLFLGTGDIWALKQVHELILPKIENGEATAQNQFREQFPNFPSEFNPENLSEEAFYDDKNIAQIEQIKAQLQTIVTKITADPCTDGLATLDETKEAVEALRQIFAPKEDEVIKTGLHFPLAIIQEVYRVYGRLFQPPWSHAQQDFFSREVIGSALAPSTAVDGQCYKNGLQNLGKMKKKGPDRQDGLFCAHPKGVPSALAPLNNKFGRTMFVDPYDGEACFLSATAGVFGWYNNGGEVTESWGGGAWRVCRVSSLCKTKAETFGGYYAATLRCVNTLPRKV